MLGAGLLHQLHLPHTLWECLGGQGILAESADGEYQHTLKYIDVLILKSYTEKYSLSSLFNLHLIFLL